MLDGIAGDDAKAVLETVLELARNGDMTAARVVLDRVWPIPKGRPTEISLPKMLTANDLVGGLAGVVTAVSAGEISTDEARDLAAVLDAHRKAIETTELEERLTELEERAKR